jgi:hypothetical protein
VLLQPFSKKPVIDIFLMALTLASSGIALANQAQKREFFCEAIARG